MVFKKQNLTTKFLFIEWQKIITYRLEFWIVFFGEMFLSILIPTVLWSTIFAAKGLTSYHGLTMDEIILYSFVAFYTFKIVMGGGKEGSISQEIYQGTMSRYLIYPMSYLYMKYVQFLATALFHLLKFFILLSVASFFTKALSHLSITSVFFYLSFVFLGMHFIFFLFTLLESMAFWADNVWSLQVMLRTSVQIMGGLFSPLIFFPTAMQSFLPFSPLTHCIFTPTFLIMGKTSYPLLPSYLSLMLGLVILATLQRMVWKRGIIKFEAAGM